jgi:hypothetical protein
LLRWAHLDDPRSGIPVSVKRWRWEAHPSDAAHGRPTVEFELRLPPRTQRSWR